MVIKASVMSLVLLPAIVNTANAQDPYPSPSAWQNSEYTVRSGELAAGYFPLVRIPAGSTLKFADDVTSVNLRIGRLEFGVGSTIDLSAPVVPPPRAQPGEDQSVQPPEGYHGNPGGVGHRGTNGRPGRSLTLQVDEVLASGSLWVRTDGGPGGAGGTGGRGQLGGGSACIPTKHAGNGGDGGPGGPGGAGGATSAVRIEIRTPTAPGYTLIPAGCIDRVPIPPSGFPPKYFRVCGSSLRPESANGNTGAIIIAGMVGCGGPGGAGGEPADPGDYNVRRCAIGPDGKAGSRGRPGNLGENGSHGTCTITNPIAGG